MKVGDVLEIVFVPRHQRQIVEQGRCGDDGVRQSHLLLLPQYDSPVGNEVVQGQFRQVC